MSEARLFVEELTELHVLPLKELVQYHLQLLTVVELVNQQPKLR
jgi:hypothetical protein